MAREITEEEIQEVQAEERRAKLAKAWEGVALVVVRSERAISRDSADRLQAHLLALVRPYSEAPIAVLEPGMNLELLGKEGQPYGVLEIPAEAVGFGKETGETVTQEVTVKPWWETQGRGYIQPD